MPVDEMQQAARLAGQVLLERRLDGSRLQVETKGLNDFVTAVDRQAEEVIVSFLEKRWPGIPFLAEECDDYKTQAPERWIVDPLDGTTNYIHGYPCFAVSIAFQSDGGIVAGVVYDPVRDEMFSSRHGHGATLNGRRLAVSSVRGLDTALLVTGFPFRELEHLEQYLQGFRRLLQQAAGVRRDGSAALDLCFVAASRFDGFWEQGLSPWDVAAGALLVQEAGGLVTDYSGGSLWLEGKEIVAAAPGIHQQMLTTLQAAAGG